MLTPLKNELALIIDHELLTLTELVLAAAPSCFWHMPAATTGKYHPAISLGEGGLIRHTKAVVRLTAHLLAMNGIDEIQPEYSLAIAAAILHDCCKKADNEKYTAFDHPRRAADLIRREAEFMPASFPRATAAALASIVECHMGRWNVNARTGECLPRPLTPLQRLVHCADYLASRKDITLADIS